MQRKTRVERERRTVAAMIHIYCHGQHGTSGETLCEACQELQTYANQRLANCPFQEGKTTCARCPIHCYKPEMGQKIKTVMRYAGPRMLLRHPIMALQHLLDGLQKEPQPSPKTSDTK